MIQPFDVAHVNLNVTDLDRAIRFYTEILGFRIAFQYEDAITWLNFGQYRDDVKGFGHGFHDVALYKVGKPAPDDRRRCAGMNHLALRLHTPEDVDRAAQHLQSNGVTVLKGPLTHKEDRDRYLYFEDPDGNMIELWPRQWTAGQQTIYGDSPTADGVVFAYDQTASGVSLVSGGKPSSSSERRAPQRPVTLLTRWVRSAPR